MQTSQLDEIATTLARTGSRRHLLRAFGAAVFTAGGLSLLDSAAGDARKRRKRRRKRQKEQEQERPPAPDVTITAITSETTAEAAHDNIVVAFVNNGDQPATGFRIGMTVQRSDGTLRNEVFSLPLTLEPGATGVEKFRLGCSWINSGAVTARTDPSPVPGEARGDAADNQLTVSFASDVCS